MAFYVKKPTTLDIPHDNNWKYTSYTGSGWSETFADRQQYANNTTPNSLCADTADWKSQFFGATVGED